MMLSTEGVMPSIENAPGLKWRKTKTGWEARWRARADLVRKGYEPANVRLWSGVEMDSFDIAYVQDRCNALQSEMAIWAKGGLPAEEVFDGTVSSLARAYQTDPDSSYHK